MIKQNKIYIILIAILEILFMIGAYATNFYTGARLGMNRHMIYQNGIWEDMLTMQTIKWILVVIIIVLGLLILLRFRKEKVKSVISNIIFIWTIAISIWSIYFLITYNTERNLAYYILSVCFVAITICQNLLNHCFINKNSNQD